MKKVVIAFLVGLTGCATTPPATTWSEWRGQTAQKAGSGTVHVVDGMELWAYGQPDRPFQALGLMEQNFPAKNRLLDGDRSPFIETELVKTARAHGADAIVLIEVTRYVDSYRTVAPAPATSAETTFAPTAGGVKAETTYYGGHGGGTYAERAWRVKAVAVKYLPTETK